MEEPMDMNEVIGQAAGKVYNYLNGKDEATLAALKKDLEMKGDEATFALGWLAREDKLAFEKKGNSLKVRLK